MYLCPQQTKSNKSMKSEKENEMGVAIGVDNEVIEKVRSGEIANNS